MSQTFRLQSACWPSPQPRSNGLKATVSRTEASTPQQTKWLNPPRSIPFLSVARSDFFWVTKHTMKKKGRPNKHKCFAANMVGLNCYMLQWSRQVKGPRSLRGAGAILIPMKDPNRHVQHLYFQFNFKVHSFYALSCSYHLMKRFCPALSNEQHRTAPRLGVVQLGSAQALRRRHLLHEFHCLQSHAHVPGFVTWRTKGGW